MTCPDPQPDGAGAQAAPAGSTAADLLAALERRLAAASGGRARVDALNALAWEIADRDTARAEALCHEAASLALAGDEPYQAGIADSLAGHGYVARMRGDYPEALRLAREAMDLGAACGRYEAVCHGGWVAGRVYVTLGEYAEAMQAHLRQLEASERLADRAHRALALSCIGLVYDETGDAATALRYHREALECAREAGSRQEEATCLLHLSWTCFYSQAYAEGLRYGEEGLALLERWGSERTRLILLNNIGAIYTRLGRREEALRHFQRVLGRLNDDSEPFLQVFAAKWAGTLYREMGQLDKAEAHLARALRIAEQLRQVRDEYELHEQLGRLYRGRGETGRAITHYERSLTIKDHAYQHEVATKLRALELAHRVETAEKEAEIARLRRAELEREVVERRRAEAALQDQNEQLEEMVAERTRALQEAQEQLVRRERLAALGQLAGGVAHELRNPLGVISNAVYFLQLAQPDAAPKVREYLEMIQTRVNDAERIISALLNFARSRPQQRQLVEAATLVADALQSVERPAGTAAEVTIPAGLPPILVDPQQIKQVLVNLFVNAFDAMGGGGVLRVAASGEAGAVTLSIADTGAGMSPTVLARIFEPLFSTKPNGIGIGLAITHSLVEANQGTIRVESAPGQGTVFYLTLPGGWSEP